MAHHEQHVLAQDPLAQETDLIDSVIRASWASYKATGDLAARERLITHYAPLVSMVASRIRSRLPSSVEHADLVSAGIFGLIDAIEKYSLNREVQFEAYATSRIRGSIIDELRSLDWTPRSVRAKARRVDEAIAMLEAKFHRTPTIDEIAGHLGINRRDVEAVQADVSHGSILPLDELVGVGPDRVETASRLAALESTQCTDPMFTMMDKEGMHLLAQAVQHLAERERLVIVLYYFEGMRLSEIGAVLGVTESRISQIHSAAVARLRTWLEHNQYV